MNFITLSDQHTVYKLTHAHLNTHILEKKKKTYTSSKAL